MINYKIENKLHFSEISNTHFSGKIDNYMMRFFKHRVLSDFAKETIFQEAEDALENPRDDKTIVGHWSGEFWGKLAISACRVYEYTQDEGLLAFIKESAYRVLSYAREDGYINSYQDSANVFAPNPKDTIPVMGWECDWNWNIWCRKYVLWGLIECAVLTKDKTILDGAHRLAEQLIQELKEKNIRLGDTGTASFCGMPSGSIIKPMLILYRMTEDESLLQFCIDVAEDWDREDGLRPNLIRNALSGKPIHQWYPDSHLWAKAYEMMSCLEGLLELYRVTGTEKYFKAVVMMYELIKAHESNVMGSVAFNDVFANAAIWENGISEPCDVIHWMRLCSELFTLTGEPEYMDSVEKAFYNAFLAGVSSDGQWAARGVRTSGRHMDSPGQSGCAQNHCCVDNMPRGYLNVTSGSVMRGIDGWYINQFCPFRSIQKKGALEIICADGYMETGCATIQIKSDCPETFYLRVPAWAGEKAMLVCEKETTTSQMVLEPGTYAVWDTEPGTNIIKIDFDYAPVLHNFDGTFMSCPDTDMHIYRWRNENRGKMPLDAMMNQNCAYITYGPLLLAQSKKLGTSEKELFEFESIYNKEASIQIHTMPIECTDVFCRFEGILIVENSYRKIELCDYASASDVLSNSDEKYFNIYL